MKIFMEFLFYKITPISREMYLKKKKYLHHDQIRLLNFDG